MGNILTITRRELGAYFTSPIGYMFVIVFLLISVGLYITSFFTFPVADMRSYFNNLPILMCVFIPAVTMRMWAEDRKENTWELLLTFPMRARELVLGKYLATVIFFALTLAATCTVPIMLAWLGNPDNGAIIGGYFGTLLLGAFFLAIGIFISGFCKDQIVAFVLSLLVCFAIFLLGTSFIAAYIDGVVPGFGSLLAELVGMYDHFVAFTRGVVEIADVLYFVVWTGLFLFLNIVYIEGRGRAGARMQYGLAIALCFGIGFAFNWLIAGQSLGRFDMTEEKVFTISDASKTVLSKLDDTVQVKVYITPKAKMPTGMKDLEQNITDKLEELRVASGGKIEYSRVPLEAANLIAAQQEMFANQDEEGEVKEESDVIEQRMLEKGVEPFEVQAIEGDQVTQKFVFSSIGIAYQDKTEEILPRIDPNSLQDLEYRVVNTIYKLSRENPPRVALVAPKEAVTIDPQMRQMLEQMGQPVPTSDDPYIYLQQILEYEKYEVSRVDLTAESPLPEEFDTLVVVNPRDLNARQKWEINRALHSGKPVVLAVQNYEWNYSRSQQGVNLSKQEQKPLINDLLSNFGLSVEGSILMDVNSVPLTVQSQGGSLMEMLSGGMTVNLPTHILLNQSSMDLESPITSKLGPVFYLWGSPISLDEEELKKHGLEAKVLMQSTVRSWTAPGALPPTQETFEEPTTGTQRYPLMAMVTGQFPDVYKDQPRPEWPPPPPPQPGMPPTPPPPPDAEAGPVTPAPGKLILIGCATTFNKNFLQPGSGNLDLFLNTVDTVTLGDELLSIRGKKPLDRFIDRPTPGQRTFWRVFNYGFMSVLIAGIGITSMLMRKRSRNAYTMEKAQSN